MSSSGAEYVRGNVSHVIEIAGVVLLFWMRALPEGKRGGTRVRALMKQKLVLTHWYTVVQETKTVTDPQ